MRKKAVERKLESKNDLLVKRFFSDVSLPEYMMKSDVGLDLKAYETITLKPLEQKAVRTGIAIKIPDNCVGLIRDRAGIVSKMNVHTAAGTFDPDYRGEVSVLLINFSDDDVEIEKGMRIAQLVVMPVIKVKVKQADKLPVTERYDKSFGSTGIKERVQEFKKLEEDIELDKLDKVKRRMQEEV